MVLIIAEIGINHNGDIDIAKKLIDMAVQTGCDAVKFQKRTVEKVYPKDVLDSPRDSPWGKTTRDQKLGLEFNEKEYDVIDKYCKQKEIEWFADNKIPYIDCCDANFGILQFNLGKPIDVSTRLFSKIFDFRIFEPTDTFISFLLISFDNRYATHLVPFPHASDLLPSEL